MTHILLGDDDTELSDLLAEYLTNHGIECDCAYLIILGIHIAQRNQD